MKKFCITFLFFLMGWSLSMAQESRIPEYVDFLTHPELMGRKAGSEGERRVASYVYDRFVEYGLTLFVPSREGQDFSIVRGQDTVRSRNIIGVVNGYDPQLKDKYIVVGANMDHLGVNQMLVDGQQMEQVYPGANNNASGLACLLELAQMVQETSFLFRRSVVFVAFGAKEEAMAGSWYFVNKAFPYVSDIDMMVNLNMLGRHGKRNVFSYSTVNYNNDIVALVDRMSQEHSMMPPAVLENTILPSDFLPFYEKEIPVVLFTTGMHPEYNTIRDTREFLDLESMEFHTHYIYYFLMELANADEALNGDHFVVEASSEEGVYSFADVDEAPTFFKGDAQHFLNDWVYSYLRYPKEAMEKGLQGTVYVEFIIETDGSLRNARIVQSAGEDLDKEALRVVNASPKWKAGKLAGTKVRVKYVLPVEFRLKRR